MHSPIKMRRIFIEKLKVLSYIGILEHEKKSKQPLIIDAEFDTQITQEAQDNNIDTVLDYRELRNLIIDECTKPHTNLLETLADRITNRIYMQFLQISQIRIRISKPNAFPDCSGVGIDITVQRKP